MSNFLTADEMYEQSLHRTTIGMCAEKGWRILLTCSTCGHGGGSYAGIDVTQLGDYPADLTMKALAVNATFSTCGHKGAWIDHRQQGIKQMPYAPPKYGSDRSGT